MGYKTKMKKTLHQQVEDRAMAMLHVGESRNEAKREGTADDTIFSYDTLKTYKQHWNRFCKYMTKEHPEIESLDDCRPFVYKWLESLEHGVSNKGTPYSAYSLQTIAKAMGKLFDIRPDDSDYYTPPVRKREDITRSRNVVERDKHFSEANNREFVFFCKGTGCRRQIAEKVKGSDLYTREDLVVELDRLNKKETLDRVELNYYKQITDALDYGTGGEYYLHHRTDKGGKTRFSVIVEPYVDDIVKRMKNTEADKKVWLAVPSNADIHSYRSDYATALYKKCARDIDSIPYDKVHPGTGHRYRSEVYVCRKDCKGKQFDKKALLVATKNLGHNRIDVVAGHYLRDV